MARVCMITGKRGMTGNSVSHSQRRTKRVQQLNLIKKRLFVPEQNRTITVRLSVRALRTLNKKGILQTLKDEGVSI